MAVEPDADNGLYESSFIEIDKVSAVPVDRIGRRIGQLDSTMMEQASVALAAYLGLARA